MPVDLTSPKPADSEKTTGKKPITGYTVLMYLLGFFAVILVANVFLIYLAFNTWTGLEVDSSYRAGQTYQRELDRAAAQESRGWKVTATAKRLKDGTVTVRIRVADAQAAPVKALKLKAHLSRPTNRKLDKMADLTEHKPGEYAVDIANVEFGQWDLVLEALRDGNRVYKSRNRLVFTDKG